MFCIFFNVLTVWLCHCRC